MFHVKQYSFNSANPSAFCFCKMHTVWLVCPIFRPLPREGIMGRGCEGSWGVMKWFVFHVKHSLRYFLKNSQLELWFWLVRLGR